MDEKLTFEYDKLGDTLHIEKCSPYAGQTTDDLDDLVLGRFNPTTGDLEAIQILLFMQRLEESGSYTLPVSAKFKPAVKADV